MSEKKYGRIVKFSPPDITEHEISEVIDTLKSGWITTGPKTKLLERRLAAFIDQGKVDIDCSSGGNFQRYSDRVVCLSSATAAEEMNLRVLGIEPGDEVIVPAYTYTATVSAAIHCGAKVVFVDIQKDGDKDTHAPEMDYDKLEKAITPRTKAIITVDLGGVVCDYDRIFEIAERKKSLFKPKASADTALGRLSARIQREIGRIAVVADCAHALGASRTVSEIVDGKVVKTKKFCGAIADFSSFSFHAVKNFTTAEGGASTWRAFDSIDDEEIYDMYQLLSLHGQNKDAFSKNSSNSWEYDIIAPYYKCNMTDIMSSIGLGQLDRYPGLLEKRKEIVSKYDTFMDKHKISHLIHSTSFMESSKHLYLIRLQNINENIRNEIIKDMGKCGVSVNVHYKPLPMMTAYKAYAEAAGGIKSFSNSYGYYSNLISLPLHTQLSPDDVYYVCECLEDAAAKYL